MTLSDRIEADLAARLKGRIALPCELKLEPLAAYYGTSTRPVREAMSRLKRRGLLGGKRVRSLKIDPQAPVDAGASRWIAPSSAPSKKEMLVQIVRDLVPRSLQGEEAFLREPIVAERFGVSTTIVRELFSQLVGRGVLEHVPRRGWRLRPLRQKDLDDFLAVRETLEVQALELAWDRLDLAEIRKFLDLNVLPKDQKAQPREDNQFHRRIIETADNAYITDFFDRHGPYFELLFEWEGMDPRAARETIVQHRRILQAILDRDLADASRQLRIHIRSNHPVLTRILKNVVAASY